MQHIGFVLPLRILGNFLGLWAVAVILSIVGAFAAGTISDDGIQWDFQNVNESVAVIGDVHADPETLIRQLRSMKLINTKNKWIGGKTHLVFLGDLNDRGHDSKAVFDLVMRLEKEAVDAGGRVHTLLGNHELLLMRGIDDYVSDADRAKLTSDGDIKKIFQNPENPYSKWFAGRNTMLRINRTLYVHGGLTRDLVRSMSPGQINSLMRSSIRHLQDPQKVPAPNDGADDWVYRSSGDRSPLWVRGLSSQAAHDYSGLVEIREASRFMEHEFGDDLLDDVPFNVNNPLDSSPSDQFKAKFGYEPLHEKPLSEADLDFILKTLDVDRIVIGHTPNRHSGYEISLIHPVFGTKVIGMDTAMSQVMGGRPSGLWVRGNELEAVYAKDPGLNKKMCVIPVRDLGRSGSPLKSTNKVGSQKSGKK